MTDTGRIPAKTDSPLINRLLVVADGARLTDLVRARYPQVQVAVASSFMSGVAELAAGPVHGILAFVDPSFGSLQKAVRGLRTAAGENAPLVLCCAPEAEPLARQAMAAGASDYLICPPVPGELDEALALRPPSNDRPVPPAPPPSPTDWNDVLQTMAHSPHRLLESLARMIRTAFDARAVEVQADGRCHRDGPEDESLVLQFPMSSGDQDVGEIALAAPRTGAYSAADLDRIQHQAAACAHVIAAVHQTHHWRTLAMTDDLTRLPNRRYLLGALDRVVRRAGRERLRATVCMFDIDNFKSYNDTYGHAAGDRILKATGELLLRHCRIEDVVSRYGGDEFAVVFWDAEGPRVAGSQHPEQAIEVMRRFQQTLREYNIDALGQSPPAAPLTISGGLATFPWHGLDSDTLLARADEALLEAKRQGKNRIHLIDPARYADGATEDPSESS